MLAEIVILSLLALLQTTFIPLDLVLIFLVCRSFVSSGRSNFYLAFCFGIMVSLMATKPVATFAIFYLLSVEVVQILKRTELSNYWLAILPISILVFLLENLLDIVMFGSWFSWTKILSQLGVVLPFFVGLKIWHERFVGQKDFRLKLKG